MWVFKQHNFVQGQRIIDNKYTLVKVKDNEFDTLRVFSQRSSL